MSNETSKSIAFDPVMQPFVDLWSDFMSQANETTREFLDEFDDNSNVRTWQRRWFDAVSKSMDAYMRSPIFLQMVKQNTEAAVKVKRQSDDLATEIAATPISRRQVTLAGCSSAFTASKSPS